MERLIEQVVSGADRLLSTAEVVERLGVSAGSVMKWHCWLGPEAPDEPARLTIFRPHQPPPDFQSRRVTPDNPAGRVRGAFLLMFD
jgi:hypothetical protein